MNGLLQKPENWVCHFRVVCESQVFARAQASLGVLVCRFYLVKNVWNEWEAFLQQRECTEAQLGLLHVLEDGRGEETGWHRHCWEQTGAQGKRVSTANAPMEAPSSLEDMQGSVLEFHVKERLGYIKFR